MTKLHIWCMIALLLSLGGVRAQPTTLSNRLWLENNLDVSYPTIKQHDQLPIKNEFDNDSVGEEETAEDGDDDGLKAKRGFSMLARWKPFNSLGKQRITIREINRALFPYTSPQQQYDIVSAETRAFTRPVGQPLRWG